jgi:hypothetical protein
MTVEKFQSQYLGYKKTKKPIVRDFTSNMIKSIHKMAPKLKVSDYHEIASNFPKSSLSTARTQKRSHSLGKTLQSDGNTLALF